MNKLLRSLLLFKSINLLEDKSAKNIIIAINIDTTAIERFERKNELEKSEKNSFIIPPIQTIGIVPIKRDLYNLLEKNDCLGILECKFLKLKILFLKYQNNAKTLPICIIADNDEPGSLIPNNKDIIFK